MPDGKVLDETNRAKLDGIVQKMTDNGEADTDIQFVVNDFKEKYGAPPKQATQSTNGAGVGSENTAPQASTSVGGESTSNSDLLESEFGIPKPTGIKEEPIDYTKPIGYAKPVDVPHGTKITKPLSEVFKEAKLGVKQPNLQDFIMPSDDKRKQPSIDDLTNKTAALRHNREEAKFKATELEKGLQNIALHGQKLMNDYEQNPTPELKAEIEQQQVDYTDTKKAYDLENIKQDLYEKKLLRESKSIKKLANDQVPDDIYSALYKGIKATVGSAKEDTGFLGLDKAGQIAYAKKQEEIAPTKEAGIVEEGAEMVGGVIPDVVMAIGTSLFGLPMVGAETVAIRQGLQQGTQSFVSAFNKAKAEGIETGDKDAKGKPIMKPVTDDEAYDIAVNSRNQGFVTGFAEGQLGAATSAIGSKVANKMATKGGQIAVEKGLDTAFDMTAAGGLQATRNALDQEQGLDVDLGEGVGKTMLGEGLLSIPVNTYHGVQEYSTEKKKEAVKEVKRAIFESKSNPVELNKLQSNLDVLKSQKRISEKDYTALNDKAEEFIKIVESIPDNVKDVKGVADLIDERNELEFKKEKLDKSFHPPLDETISAINNEIVDFYNGLEESGDNEQSKKKIKSIAEITAEVAAKRKLEKFNEETKAKVAENKLKAENDNKGIPPIGDSKLPKAESLQVDGGENKENAAKKVEQEKQEQEKKNADDELAKNLHNKKAANEPNMEQPLVKEKVDDGGDGEGAEGKKAKGTIEKLDELTKAIETLKSENPKEFKKDGTPKAKSKILPSYKALVDMKAVLLENASESMQGEFNKRAKAESEKSRLETEAINKAFEERQAELEKNLTPEQIQEEKDFDETNRIFNKVQNEEKPTKEEIEFVNKNAWLPQGYKFGENGLEKKAEELHKPEQVEQKSKYEVSVKSEKVNGEIEHNITLTKDGKLTHSWTALTEKGKESRLKLANEIKSESEKKDNEAINEQKDKAEDKQAGNEDVPDGGKAKKSGKENLNEPVNAKGVAQIFRKLFNFSTFESAVAARMFEAKAKRMSEKMGISKEDYYKQYWFDDKAENGIDKERKGQWNKEAAKAKRFISMYEKADSTTAAHEILGHDYIDRIIEASETDAESKADLRTIAEEFKEATGSKKTIEQIVKDLKDFDVESNQTQAGKAIHEWFATTAEHFFASENNVKTETPKQKKIAQVFEKFRQHLVDLFNKMSKQIIEPSEPMKKIFQKVFGSDNFNEMNNAIVKAKETAKKDIYKTKLTDEKRAAIKARIEGKEKGLGQPTDADYETLMDAAAYLKEEGLANYYNLTKKLKEYYPEHEAKIDEYKDDLKGQFIPEGQRVRETAESVFNSLFTDEDVKNKLAEKGVAGYTPENLKAELAKNNELVDDVISEFGLVETLKTIASGVVSEKNEPMLLAIASGRTNNAIKQIRKSRLSAAEKKAQIAELSNLQEQILEKYSNLGTDVAQKLNYFKVFKNMSPDAQILHFKKRAAKALEGKTKSKKAIIAKYRNKVSKMLDGLDHISMENVGYEERIGELEETVSRLEKDLENHSKSKTRENNVKNKRNPNAPSIKQSDALAEYKKAIAEGLGQDITDLNAAEKLAYSIISEKAHTVEQFVKAWNKLTGEKKDITELQDVYSSVRDFAVNENYIPKNEFDTDAQIQISVDKHNEKEVKKKVALAKAKLDLEIAKAERDKFKKQMSEKDKEVRAKEALKKREKEITQSFLDGLAHPELWKQYVNNATNKIIGNLAQKLGVGGKDKALLDKFTSLVTNELNSAINELIPKDKGNKAKENYAQQLGDLLANEDKVAQVFDKAVKDFADQHKNNINAHAIISKLNGLKNPFSEKLLSKALEKEADNYAVKIKDLAFKYASQSGNLSNLIIDRIIHESELTGTKADQLKQDLKTKFDEIIAEEEKNVAGNLANAIIADAKRANGAIANQQDYTNQLLGYLKSKAKDTYEAAQGKGLTDPYEQMKYAVNRLNDINGRKIWDDSRKIINQKIDADQNLTQTEKDALKQHLNNFQNTIFDQLLSENKQLKVVEKALLEKGIFDGKVDWKKFIKTEPNSLSVATDELRDAIQAELQGYPQQQVDNLVQAVEKRLTDKINEVKKLAAQEQLDNLATKLYRKIVPTTKQKATAFSKLQEMENTGLLNEQGIDEVISDFLGMKKMDAIQWQRVREMLEDIQDAPEGNEKDFEIDKMASYVKLHSDGAWFDTFVDLNFAGKLSGISTIIKNWQGWIEPFLKAYTSWDKNYIHFGKEAAKQGDFKAVLQGGIVQGSKLDSNVGEDGLPHARILENITNDNESKFKKFLGSAKYPTRLLSAPDAKNQKRVSNMEDYRNLVKYIMVYEGQTDIKAARVEARQRIESISMTDAFNEANTEFARRGINPTEARLTRRAYEIRRKKLDDMHGGSISYLSDLAALDEAYKIDLVKLQRGAINDRLNTNSGVMQVLGSMTNEIVNAVSGGVGTIVGKVSNEKIGNATQVVIKNEVLPFVRGMSNVMEFGLEKSPYGMLKGLTMYGQEWNYTRKNPITTKKEMMEHLYMQGKAKDKIRKSAAASILGGALTLGVIGVMRSMQDDDEKDKDHIPQIPVGIYAPNEVTAYGKNSSKNFVAPATGAMVVYINGKSHVIPLSLGGTMGIGASMTAATYDSFLRNNKKEASKLKDPDEWVGFGKIGTFAASMANVVTSNSAYQGSSELLEMIDPSSTMNTKNYLMNKGVGLATTPVPYLRNFNQLTQTVRSFVDNSAQQAIGIKEKAFKAVGLAGIAYDRPVVNYRGEEVPMNKYSIEGISGLTGIFNSWKLDPTDKYLLYDLNFNPTYTKRLDPDFKNKDGEGLSEKEYYDYKVKTSKEFGDWLEHYLPKVKHIKLSDERQDELKEKAKLLKIPPIDVVRDGITKRKRETVGKAQNLIEEEEQLRIRFANEEISPSRYKKEKEELKKKKDSLIKILNNEFE